MNKRFEAVPYKDWLKSKPKKGTYNVLINGEKASYNFYEPEDGLFYVESDSTTHVLVPLEDQWISVEEKLPDFDGQVIVAFVSGETRARFFNFQKKTFYMDDVNLNLIVTHWMPLPTSPKDTEQLKPLD